MNSKEKRTPEGFRLQKWEKADTDLVPIQPGDATQEVIRSGINAIRKQRRGHPPTYPATPEGLQMFQEAAEQYFQGLYDYNSELEEGRRGVLPDVEGLCISCGISRVTFMAYGKRGGEWGKFILFLRDCIAAARKQAASNYQSPVVFEIFNLKANFDYVERSELKLTTEPATTEEQLQDAIDEIGLRWNEQTGEYEPAEGADYDG